MERSYLIKQCARFDGVTYLTVDGQVKKEDVGKKIIVEGVSEERANGHAAILEIVPPDTIRFAQKGMPNIPAALKGGRVVFLEETAATAPPPTAKPPVPPAAAKPAVPPPVVPKPTPPPVPPKPSVPPAKPAAPAPAPAAAKPAIRIPLPSGVPLRPTKK